MIPDGDVITGLVLLIVLTSSLLDFYYHRLPNTLTFGSTLAAIALQWELNGLSGAESALLGSTAALILFVPFYSFRWMGAGDVKLLVAVGAFLGWPVCLDAFLATLSIGVVISLGIIAWHRGMQQYLTRYAGMLRTLLTQGRLTYIQPTSGEPGLLKFPYAFVIALGTIAVLIRIGRINHFFNSLSDLFA